MESFYARIVELIEPNVPVTLRQTYYLCVANGVYEKDTGRPRDKNYRATMNALGILRESGRMPWEWIADNTRWVREAQMHSDLHAALDDMQSYYRRDYWRDQPYRVEVWVESDSIASFISAITHELGVPLFVCKGQASKAYLKGAADTSAALRKPVKVLYVGDWDPTGVAIDVSVHDRYERYAPGAHVDIERIAVTPDQIRDLGLADHTANPRDSNYAKFVARCEREGLPVAAVETEAIPPRYLRALVRACIWQQIDEESWSVQEAYEQGERETLARFVAGFGGDT